MIDHLYNTFQSIELAGNKWYPKKICSPNGVALHMGEIKKETLRPENYALLFITVAVRSLTTLKHLTLIL